MNKKHKDRFLEHHWEPGMSFNIMDENHSILTIDNKNEGVLISAKVLLKKHQVESLIEVLSFFKEKIK